MAGLIPRHFIDDLLVRIDIVELIDSHLPLKKKGMNYGALCPFHNEKSPSFSVNRKKQFFYCFGCGASGNAISFLMDYSHLTFVESIEELASFVGIDVPREQGNYHSPVKSDHLKEIYALLETITQFYTQQFKTNSKAKIAIDYLKSRGVTGEVARDFRLGYAPDQWNKLTQHFDLQPLLEAGLVVEKATRNYDRFRGRLMFPIRDKRGRILGFGARVLDDSLPKYLNSPETAVFSKSNEVYGLYELLQHQGKPEKILIVEGYLDVISLAQFGLHYAIATLGTATSRKHLEGLFRFTSELVLCFDGDQAGRNAAWKAVETVMPTLKDGRKINIILLPQGEDPDSLIRKEGFESFSKRILKAQALSDYFFEHLIANLNLATLEGRSQLVTLAQPYLQQLPEGIFKTMMIAHLQKLSELSMLAVSKNTTTLDATRHLSSTNTEVKLSLARFIVALLLQNPYLAEVVIKNTPHWRNFTFPGADVLKNMTQTIMEEKPANMGRLIEYYRGSHKENMINVLAKYDLEPEATPKKIIKQIFVDGLNKLIQQDRKARLNHLLIKEKNQHLDTDEKQILINILKS